MGAAAAPAPNVLVRHDYRTLIENHKIQAENIRNRGLCDDVRQQRVAGRAGRRLALRAAVGQRRLLLVVQGPLGHALHAARGLRPTTNIHIIIIISW